VISFFEKNNFSKILALIFRINLCKTCYLATVFSIISINRTLCPLIPKGMLVPYLEFWDFGHTTRIPIYNWIFETFWVDGKFKALSNKPLYAGS
jgi:hypothetical protein